MIDIILWKTLFMLMCTIPVWATVQNITVDDQYGDKSTGAAPTYSPPSAWGQGAGCTVCTAKVNTSLAHNGTWHDSTHLPGSLPSSVTILFNGTALYAFCILPNYEFAPYPTNLSFLLDNKQVGTFIYVPSATSDYQYNVPVYANPNVSNGSHNFTMVTAGGDVQNLVLFDYFVYTVNTAEPTAEPVMTSKKKSKVVPIVAGLLGGFAGLIVLSFIIYKTTRKSNPQNTLLTIEPFVSRSRPPTDPPTVDVGDTGTIVTATPTKYTPIHTRMISADTTLVSTTDPSSGSSNDGRMLTSQATSSSSSSRPNYSKLSGQARDREMQTRSSQQTSPPPPENVGSIVEVDPAITAQIDALKREVQGLREAQEEMLGIVAPPEYDAGPPR